VLPSLEKDCHGLVRDASGALVREIGRILGGEVFESLLSRAFTFRSRSPSDDVAVLGRNRLDLGDDANSSRVKDCANEVAVPRVGARIPEISNVTGEMVLLDGEVDAIMNILPDWTPRAGPYAGVSPVDLDSAVLKEVRFNLQEG